MATAVGVRVSSLAPRRSKVRFAPTSFMPAAQKDVIRPLPCSSSPTATRCAGLAVGPPCGCLFPGNFGFHRSFHVGAKSALLRRLFSPNKSAVRLRPNVSCESYNRRLPGKNGPCNANGLLEEIFQLAIKRFFFHMLPVVFLRLPAAHRLVKSLRLYGGMTGEIQSFRALIFGPICRESK